MKIPYVLVLLCLSFLACKKNKIEPIITIVTPPITINPGVKTSGPSLGTNESDRTYNLNLIYFVPKDIDTMANYQKRLSEIMLWGQDWFKTKMGQLGYADKTFGIFKNNMNTRVRITTIYGAKNSSDYPYSGGGSVMWDEIQSYFALHPIERTSDHFLIITPRYGYKPDGFEPTGPPFYGSTYGVNRLCFALDYEKFDMKNLTDQTQIGKFFRIYLGGLFHELGHGLNLPHNKQLLSEYSNPAKGTSLMSSGNYTLGNTPTFLTPADGAILNVNQIFNKNNSTYYGNVTAAIKRIHSSYKTSNQTILISGKYETTVPVNSIIYYNDPDVNNEGVGVNKDYNAITWETKSIGLDSFYLEIPVAELEYKDNVEYQLRVKLVHTNGAVTSTSYSYSFVNSIPMLTFSTRSELSKNGWSVVTSSSEETSGEGATNGRAINVVDGSNATYWHTKWTGQATNYPHFFVVDIASLKNAGGFALSQRIGLSRSIKDFELLISTNGTDFTSLGNFIAKNSEGAQYFDFNSQKNFRYIKVISKSAWDGLQYAALAEIGLY
ncbi:MAG: discoidin domain-containing protein [Bacteroidota bacterium]